MFDALTSYAYNTGNGGISKFKNDRGQSIADLINAGDYAGAADVISKKPVTSKGTRLAGLVRRRKEEADLFMQGAENVNNSNIAGANTDGVALIGDSQMKAGIGNALKRLFPGAKSEAKTGKQPSAFKNDTKTINAISGAKKIILTLGGNGAGGTIDLINTIKKNAPNAKVIWIGAPPAVTATDAGQVKAKFGKDLTSFNAGLNARRKKRANNNTLIGRAVRAAGFTFINPTDFHNFRPSKDGIHVDKDGVPFINKVKSQLLA
jgi:hypothetical protein